MIEALKQKLTDEAEKLRYELNVTLPNEIRKAVELGDLRENSEYKAALERQQFVQARLSQLHQRMQQVQQLASTEVPTDRVGLGSRVKVVDTRTDEVEEYEVVHYPGPKSLPEMLEESFGGFVRAPRVRSPDAVMGAVGLLREAVGPKAWPAVRDSIGAMLLLREEPVVLTMPRALIFR